MDTYKQPVFNRLETISGQVIDSKQARKENLHSIGHEFRPRLSTFVLIARGLEPRSRISQRANRIPSRSPTSPDPAQQYAPALDVGRRCSCQHPVLSVLVST